MSSTTPNLGLTKTTAAETIGQNWAASNDSGGNFDIIDTKMGPVGNQSVQAQLDALNSKIATDWTGCADYKETIEASANVLLQSFGKLRILTFQGVGRAHTEDEVLMTLPTQHRPLGGAIYAPGTVGGTAVEVRINTNGQVTLFIANGAGNARLYFQACWIVA